MSKAEELGFLIKERAGAMVLTWDHDPTHCRPAAHTEVVMWKKIRALDASHQRLKEAMDTLLNDPGKDYIKGSAWDKARAALEQAKDLS